MTAPDVRAAFVEALEHVAPDVDGASLEHAEPLRDQVDLDSMDLLNLVVRLSETLGVEVPERDYPKLESVDAAVAYLEQALGSGA
jgi:acyl carrier protein